MTAACTAEKELAAAAASLRVWLPAFAIKVMDAGVTDEANGPLSRRTEVLLAAVTRHSVHMSTLQHVQSVVDTVFRPLAKYATDDDTVVALLVTIHEVINIRERLENVSESLQQRRSLFATAGVRDEVFIPLAHHVNGPGTCDLLLQALCCLSTNADCVMVFVTADVRDRILIPLVRHATSILGQQCLFLVIMNFFTTARSMSGDVLGTPAVRDRIFVAASVSPECLDCYFHALSAMVEVKKSDGTYGSSPQAALFRTQSVRDRIFLPLAPLLTIAPTVQAFLRALTRIAVHKEGPVLFGTKAVRDRLFIPVSKHVSNVGLASLFFALLYLIAEKCPRNVFGTQPFRDKVILPLASFGTSSEAAGAFTIFLFRSISDTTGDAQRLLHTAAMRDEVFIPLARHVNSQNRAGALCKLVAVVSHFRRPGEPSVFATASVRDAMIIPFARVVSEEDVIWIFRLIGSMTASDNVGYRGILATPEIRDEVFCRHAVSATKSQSAELVLVTGTLFTLIEDDPQGQRRSVFATARVRDEVLVPLFERSTSLAAIRELSAVLAAFGDVRLLGRFAARATTIEHATRLACLVADFNGFTSNEESGGNERP